MKVLGPLTFVIVLVSLAACTTPPASARANGTPDPGLMAQVTLVYAHATDTQAAQLAQYQAATDQAYQAAIYATNVSAQTQTAQAYIAGLTQSALQTQGAATANNMTAWANVTTTQLVATQQVERAARNAKIATIWAAVLMFIGAGLLVLAWAAVKIYQQYIDARAYKLQSEQISPDSHGRFPVVPDNGKKLLNPNLAHRAVVDPDGDDLTTEQALANTQSQRNLEATRALADTAAFARQMARNMALPSGTPEITDPGLQIIKQDFPLLPGAASWSLLESWDGKSGIPYGVSSNGLERLNLEAVPHGGVFGKTGEGKSRYFLRPFIAGAIAAGNRVVILGKQADFQVFASHPNVTMLPVRHFTDPNEAARYANFLKQIVVEMNRRDTFLAENHASTWQQSGRYPTLIILDELGNALDMMPSEIRKEAYRWVQGLVQEGRKAGFNVWMASQRAVGFKSIVEQLGRAVFHLADAEASRYALGVPGAEELEHGQFFAKFGRLHRCMAFDPTDEDIAKFLASRKVDRFEPIKWIDAECRDVETPAVTVETAAPEPVVDDTDSRILAMYEEQLGRDKVSLSAIQRAIYGRQIPAEFYHIQNLVKDYQEKKRAETITTTTTTTENQPPTGPVAA